MIKECMGNIVKKFYLDKIWSVCLCYIYFWLCFDCRTHTDIHLIILYKRLSSKFLVHIHIRVWDRVVSGDHVQFNSIQIYLCGAFHNSYCEKQLYTKCISEMYIEKIHLVNHILIYGITYRWHWVVSSQASSRLFTGV